MLMPKTHALVVAPFIAYGLVHFIVWLIGILSVPVLVIVKIVGKYKFGKSIAITAIILILLGLTVFIFSKVFMPLNGAEVTQKRVMLDTAGLDRRGMVAPPSVTREARAPEQNFLTTAFFKLTAIFSAFVVIPNLLVITLINIKLKKWNKLQAILVSLASSIILAGLASFILILIKTS